jgi:ParB-like chromosome segregation protein Spo0J
MAEMVYAQSARTRHRTSRTPVATSSRRASAAKPSGVIHVPLVDLRSEPTVRFCAVDQGHVAALAEVPDRWPPILVRTSSMAILDGLHRVEAARRLGLSRIRATLFEGTEEEAFVEAVRRNNEHGLPLSLPERRRAARRLLAMSPERSDRAIAGICGLDHKTIGRLRLEFPRLSSSDSEVEVRVGRDQRVRPLDAARLRSRIAAALAEAPNESLRQIARRVGASPETVRDVRACLARGDAPAATPGRVPTALVDPDVQLAGPQPWPNWITDSACQSVPSAAEFAAWFDSGGLALDWTRFVDAVPLSRVYEISDQARAYGAAWRQFAEVLERRSRPGCGSVMS